MNGRMANRRDEYKRKINRTKKLHLKTVSKCNWSFYSTSDLLDEWFNSLPCGTMNDVSHSNMFIFVMNQFCGEYTIYSFSPPENENEQPTLQNCFFYRVFPVHYFDVKTKIYWLKPVDTDDALESLVTLSKINKYKTISFVVRIEWERERKSECEWVRKNTVFCTVRRVFIYFRTSNRYIVKWHQPNERASEREREAVKDKERKRKGFVIFWWVEIELRVVFPGYTCIQQTLHNTCVLCPLAMT